MTDPPNVEKEGGQAGGVVIGDVKGGIINSIIAGGNVIQKITHVFAGAAEDRDRRNRLILLDKVTQFWINGVLEQSVHRETLLELRKVDQPDAVEHPWNLVLDGPCQDSDPVPSSAGIAEIFDRMGRSLLILGEPGSGKTITLLELARHCGRRARAAPGEAIPVVLTLSSWGQKRRKLADWIADELNAKYQIPEKIARTWIDHDDLLLLLDGLDEVAPSHRSNCAEAINEFHHEHGLTPIAVSSRVAEHRELKVKLSLQGAVSLQPLTSTETARYFESAGPRLGVLRAQLEKDAALQELATSPLMLSIMSLAYVDAQVSDAEGSGTQSVDSRRKRLFETYVARMFRRRTRGPAADAATTRRLSWLARTMQMHDQTVFLFEQLQPTWLSTRWQRSLYALGSRLIAGFGMAAAFMLTFIGAAATDSLADWRALTVIFLSLVFGSLGASIAIGIRDAWRIGRVKSLPEISRPSNFRQTCVRVAGTTLVALSGFALGSIYFLAPVGEDLVFGIVVKGGAGALLALPLALLLPFGFLLGGRRNTRITTVDIRVVENLTWTWQPFTRALAGAIIAAMVIFAAASFARNPGASLWDRRGHRIAFLDDSVEWAYFNREGDRVLTVGDRVLLCRASDGRHVADIPAGWQARFSADGALIDGHYDKFAFWRSSDGALILKLGSGDKWLSHHEKRAVVNTGGLATLYDVQTARVLSTFTMAAKIGTDVVQFDSADRRFVTLGSGRQLELRSAADGTRIAVLGDVSERFGGSFRINPNGSQIITFAENACRLWSSEDGTLLGSLPQADIADAKFSPDGSRIVTRTRAGALRLWDARGRTPVADLGGIVTDSDGVVCSPHGPRMLAVDSAGLAQLWSTQDGKVVASLGLGVAHIRRFSPDGARLATTARDGTITLWDSTSGARLATFAQEVGLKWLKYNPVKVAFYPAFSPSGDRIVTAGDDGRLRLWDGRDGKPIASMEGAFQFSGDPDGVVEDKLLSSDGSWLTALRKDGTLTIHDMRTGNLMASIVGVKSSRISRDGNRILTVVPSENVVRDHRALSAVAIACGLLIGIFLGMRPGVSDHKTYPNQGIWLSARNALIMGAVCGATFALADAVYVGRADHVTLLIMVGPFAFFGVLTFLYYGGLDALNHLALRVTLCRPEELPLRPGLFFDHAVECVFLRRVGGGYIFVHRLLLEYFAATLVAKDED